MQARQDELWKFIKRTHLDRRAEMSSITRGIGECTHRINGELAKLSRCKKTHKAMNIAKNYIEEEIDRLSKISNSWEDTIRFVEQGKMRLINAGG